jgi:5-methylcytosine-specific restriction endonuclease McrA
MATRFLFDPPRRPKAKPTAGIKSLLIRCPSTSKLTDTGRTIEEKRWATTKVKKQKFTCAHCGSVHSWTKEDVVLGRPLSS